MPSLRRYPSRKCSYCLKSFKPWRKASQYCTRACSNKANAGGVRAKCTQCDSPMLLSQMARTRSGNKSVYLDKCPPCQTAFNEKRKLALPWWHKRIPMMICNARIRAAASGLRCDITRADIKIPDICPVFKVPFDQQKMAGRYFYQSMAPSIDRIDSSKGYTKDNIIIVSCRANSIKSDATVDELIAITRFYVALRKRRNRSERKNRSR